MAAAPRTPNRTLSILTTFASPTNLEARKLHKEAGAVIGPSNGLICVFNTNFITVTDHEVL